MNEVKEEWKTNNYNPEGAYIAPSELANSKNYMKKVLAVKYDSKNAKTSTEEKLENSDKGFNIYPNPMTERSWVKLNLMETSKITLEVYKEGILVRTVVNNKQLGKGEHLFTINRNSMTSGMYICKLTLNDEILSRKILVL